MRRGDLRDLQDMLGDEAEKAGAVLSGIELRSKHLMAVFTRAGESRKVFMASTPSDRRAHLNNRAIVRRVLSELTEAA